MIRVITKEDKCCNNEFRLGDLCKSFSGISPANPIFIGKIVGSSDPYEMFLITYDTIVCLNKPEKNYSNRTTIFHIKRFIDIEIREISCEDNEKTKS